MGIAAYNRGSRCISRGLGNPTGETTAKPTPRPEDWGNKARERAEDHARRILAGAVRYGLPRPPLDVLVDAVRESARVGEETAIAAAEVALGE